MPPDQVRPERNSPPKRFFTSGVMPVDKRPKTAVAERSDTSIEGQIPPATASGQLRQVTDADMARSRAQLASLSAELKEHLTLVMSRTKEIVTCLEGVEKILRKHQAKGESNAGTASTSVASAPVKAETPQAMTIKRPDLEVKIQLRMMKAQNPQLQIY